jgi:hypothetical protein
MTSHNAVIATIHATEENDSSLRKYLSEVEHEIGLEEQLAQERAEHAKTRTALAYQTLAVQRVQNERQIESVLREYPAMTPAATRDVVNLLLHGDGGELEVDGKGKLRAKYDMRPLPDVVSDFLKANPKFKDADSAPAPPLLDKRTMTPKQIADYVEAHGQDAFHALPRSKDPRTK